MDRPDKKRASPVPYRPPEKLREEFYVRAKNSGLSTNAFITSAVFGEGAAGCASVSKKELAHLLSLAAQINTCLDAVCGESSQTQSVILAQCKEELSVIRQGVMQLLGKRS